VYEKLVLELLRFATLPVGSEEAPDGLPGFNPEAYGSAWMERAQCRGEDRDLFFPSVGTASAKARVICSICLVRQECLAYALTDTELTGVWGGTTTQERKRLRSDASRARCCQTPSTPGTEAEGPNGSLT
jgi:WhiB family redox-sensing transcriptional regulator